MFEGDEQIRISLLKLCKALLPLQDSKVHGRCTNRFRAPVCRCILFETSPCGREPLASRVVLLADDHHSGCIRRHTDHRDTMKYNRLGDTGLLVSELSFGSWGPWRRRQWRVAVNLRAVIEGKIPETVVLLLTRAPSHSEPRE